MRFRHLIVIALGSTSLLALTPAPAALPTRPALYGALAGNWVGSLEYKDYSKPNTRVTLPTKIGVSYTADSSALLMHFTYDDGPGKIVEDDDRFAANATVTSIAWGGAKAATPQQYTVTDGAGAKGRIAIVLQGEGEDDNKPATIRETITVSADTLRILKETRVKGGEFAFRHGYVMRRR